MTNQTDSSCAGPSVQVVDAAQIAGLRQSRGETLDEFARRIGIQSKGQMSLIERGLRVPTPEQALAIEELSGREINASTLNPIIAKARGVEWGSAHGAGDSANADAVSMGKAGENFPPCEQHQGSPVAPSAGEADPGSGGSAAGESREQDQLPGRAFDTTASRGGEGLAPEGTSGGSAGLRSGLPANASQSVGAPAAAKAAAHGGGGRASCADDLQEAAE